MDGRLALAAATIGCLVPLSSACDSPSESSPSGIDITVTADPSVVHLDEWVFAVYTIRNNTSETFFFEGEIETAVRRLPHGRFDTFGRMVVSTNGEIEIPPRDSLIWPGGGYFAEQFGGPATCELQGTVTMRDTASIVVRDTFEVVP